MNIDEAMVSNFCWANIQATELRARWSFQSQLFKHIREQAYLDQGWPSL